MRVSRVGRSPTGIAGRVIRPLGDGAAAVLAATRCGVWDGPLVSRRVASRSRKVPREHRRSPRCSASGCRGRGCPAPQSAVVPESRRRGIPPCCGRVLTRTQSVWLIVASTDPSASPSRLGRRLGCAPCGSPVVDRLSNPRQWVECAVAAARSITELIGLRSDGVLFAVLGPLELWRGEEPIALGPPQQRRARQACDQPSSQRGVH